MSFILIYIIYKITTYMTVATGQATIDIFELGGHYVEEVNDYFPPHLDYRLHLHLGNSHRRISTSKTASGTSHSPRQDGSGFYLPRFARK